MHRGMDVFTNHAQTLVCIAQDPGVRLREIATALGVTERRAFGIINELIETGIRREGEGSRR
jgi:predicted transcriptional regulator